MHISVFPPRQTPNSIAILMGLLILLYFLQAKGFGDAATAIPLAIAFCLARRKPSKCFSYGYGRVEDLAGVMVVFLILFSAVMQVMNL
ncbi:MAG: hypothetical protein QG646_2785 [Euryarchaeota archaeon]|nr:hypothetical protein [Euryarchaeota archaeon]